MNLLENGSFQYRDYGWTKGRERRLRHGLRGKRHRPAGLLHGNHGDPAKDTTAASQTVSLNLPGTQTYVLSGWAKANAVPDNVTTATGTTRRPRTRISSSASGRCSPIRTTPRKTTMCPSTPP